MIKRLKYSEIDFEKYTECLSSSVQKNFYASKENLDFLCEYWEILVFEDYEAVMPVPVKQKLGILVVLMPLFCQQLGIFSKQNDVEVDDLFLKYFIKNYRIFYYAFNFENHFSHHLKVRKNYFIAKTDYLLLRKNYFKGRKSTVKSAGNLILKEIQLNENHAEFIRKNFRGLDKSADLEKFLKYVQHLEIAGHLKMFGAYKENQLLNIAIFIEDESQLSLLGLINDDNFKRENGASFIIDAVLKENIAQNTFNFMGGSLRGIEVFFKSFGSELQEYPVIQNSKMQLIKNLLKKR